MTFKCCLEGTDECLAEERVKGEEQGAGRNGPGKLEEEWRGQCSWNKGFRGDGCCEGER